MTGSKGGEKGRTQRKKKEREQNIPMVDLGNDQSKTSAQ